MTFDLDAATAALAAAARTVAQTEVAEAAGPFDAEGVLADTVRQAARDVLPARPDEALVQWVVALEELSAVSPAIALAAAADVRGIEGGPASVQWPGCRGVHLERLRARGDEVTWQLAVTAVLVGAGRAFVGAAVEALRRAKIDGRPNEAAQGGVADAATAVDASRLLLWDAATRSGVAGRTAAGLARVHALHTVRLAQRAAEAAVGAEALRYGTPLERLRRDADTVALVLGASAEARDAVALRAGAP